ncbi:MAG: AMP-binding protein, partial [Oscillospiraceae bacterium]|nr:AMP-binding protein [Oscillospiraceae bacterium]
MSKKPTEAKPWLAFWGSDLPEAAAIERNLYCYIYERNKNHLQDIALRYFDKTISYKEMFEKIQQTARAFERIGVKKGDIITVCSVMTPETVYMFYALDLLGATTNMIDPRTSAQGIRSYI